MAVAIALAACPQPLRAQFGFSTATGPVSFFSSRATSLAFNASTSQAVLTLVAKRGEPEDDGPLLNALFSVAAQNGVSSILSDGSISPAVSLVLRFGHEWARAPAPGAPTLADRERRLASPAALDSVRQTGGFVAPFLQLGATVQGFAIGDSTTTPPITFSQSTRTGYNLSAGVGLTVAPSREFLLGFLASYARLIANPVATSQSTWCTPLASGIDPGDTAVAVRNCSQVYFGGVEDVNAAVFRFDIATPGMLLGGGRARHDVPRSTAGAAEADRSLAAAHASRNALDTDLGTQDSLLQEIIRRASAGKASLQDVAVAWEQREAASARATEARLREARAAATADSTRSALNRTLSGAFGRPQLALFGLVSADVRDGQEPQYGVLVGPLLKPPYAVLGKVTASLLFGMDDITNARSSTPSFVDRLVLKLFVGVPLAAP
jgi:hypothetical protein